MKIRIKRKIVNSSESFSNSRQSINDLLKKGKQFHFEQHIDGQRDSHDNSLAEKLQIQPSHLMSPSELNDSDSIPESAIGDNVNKFFQDENDQEINKFKILNKGIVLQLLKYFR